jgi:1,4-dihydroxy-2-naphthoate octaprenyltransferase
MDLIGDFAKGFLILTVAFWIFLIVEFVIMGQLAVVLLLFIVLIVLIYKIASELWKSMKRT